MRKIFAFTAIILAFAFMFAFSALYGCNDKSSAITSYDIECDFEGNNITGKEKVNYYNNTETSVKELKFNLFANSFRKDAKFSPVTESKRYKYYPSKKESYGGIDITSVKQGDESLEYCICGEDCNILAVSLKDEVFPEERVSVEIEYQITLAEIVARTGINGKTVNLANIYPILCVKDDDGFYECKYYSIGDPYYSECANYKVTFTYPEKYIVAASGKVISSEYENGKRRDVFTAEKIRSFTFVLSDNFSMITEKEGDIEINYYYYSDKTPNDSLAAAVKSIRLFNDKFGKYPYKAFNVVETEFVEGGMEFPMLVMISSDLEKKAYIEVIAHETAHQWWQGAVGNNEIEYAFLDEGLAEYSVVIFYENYPEYGFDRKTLINSSHKAYKTFCSVFDKINGKVDTSMMRDLNKFSGEYEYVNIAYIKSCIMYDMLRETVGEETFFKALMTYYKEFCFKNARPEDLVGVFERHGANSNGFFKSFFDGTVIL